MSTEVVCQLLGWLSFLIGISALQFKERKTILAVSIVSLIPAILHLGLLGQVSGAALTVITFVRYLVAFYSNSRMYAFAFFLVYVLVTYITYTAPETILLFLGTCCGLFACFSASNLTMRKFFLAASVLNTGYFLLIGSAPLLSAEILALASNGIGLYRFYGRTVSTEPTKCRSS